MSAAVDTMDYKLPYHTIFGGVSAFSKVHFEVSHEMVFLVTMERG